MISAITPEKENPIHIPKVPPTFPIKPISVTMTYSLNTFVYSGLAK